MGETETVKAFEMTRIWTALGDCATALFIAARDGDEYIEHVQGMQIPLIMGAIWLDKWMAKLVRSMQENSIDCPDDDDEFVLTLENLVEALAYKDTTGALASTAALVEIAERVVA